MTKSIKKNDLPREIYYSIEHTINHSTVALTGYKSNKESVLGCHGSGTFVSIKNIYGILTAKHVWDMLYKNDKIELIALSFWGDKKFTSERKNHVRVYIPNENVDICFIEIPISRLSFLKSIVTFFPLRHCPLYSSIERNFLVVAGFPFEEISIEEKLYRILYYYTDFVCMKNRNNKLDEIKLITDYNQNPNLLKTFEGVSGGGIWGLRIFKKDQNGIRRYYFKNIETYIAGVNYYQTPVKDNKRFIKGIGPYAIYNLLYNFVIDNN